MCVEVLDDRCACVAASEPGVAQALERVRSPARIRRLHLDDDSRSHQRATLAVVKTRIVLIILSLVVVAGCGVKPATVGSGSTKVVAAFYPLAYAAEQAGGRTVTVENLTPAGAEPHDLELTPRAVGDILDADFVLYLGDGFQPAVARAVGNRTGPSLQFLGGNGSKMLVEAGTGAIDPHIWLDPHRYAAIVREIGRALERPQQAANLIARLSLLDDELRRGLAHCARREIVTSHAAFGYLSLRYGLRQVPLEGLTPEAEPSAKAVQRLVGEVRRTHATTVFFETLVSPKLAQTVARAARARTAVLNPIEGLTKDEAARGEDYFTVMRANLRSLREALGCR